MNKPSLFFSLVPILHGTVRLDTKGNAGYSSLPRQWKAEKTVSSVHNLGYWEANASFADNAVFVCIWIWISDLHE